MVGNGGARDKVLDPGGKDQMSLQERRDTGNLRWRTRGKGKLKVKLIKRCVKRRDGKGGSIAYSRRGFQLGFPEGVRPVSGGIARAANG